jgi:hypothetical protein
MDVECKPMRMRASPPASRAAATIRREIATVLFIGVLLWSARPECTGRICSYVTIQPLKEITSKFETLQAPATIA